MPKSKKSVKSSTTTSSRRSRRKPITKYCSCLKQVEARKKLGVAKAPYNAFAVCRAAVPNVPKGRRIRCTPRPHLLPKAKPNPKRRRSPSVKSSRTHL